MLALLILFLTVSVSHGQMSKQEEQFWKAKAKAYLKDPEVLKTEFEGYQAQIRDLKKANKEVMDKMPVGTSKQLVDSLRWAMIQQEKEIQDLRNQKDRLEAAYRAIKTTSDQGMKPGLIYRVQIGAFVFYEMQNQHQDEDFLVERADGYNKYIMGNFRSVEEAQVFVDELLKLGLRGPWVVPYIDGVRVTNREADEYQRKQGTGRF